MVKNLRLPAAADFLLEWTDNKEMFNTYYELFVFGASYGRKFRVLDGVDIDNLIIQHGKIKDPISFSYFQTEDYDDPLAIILFSHFGGDLVKFKDVGLCKQVLEAYAQKGLEKFHDDLSEQFMNTDPEAISDYYEKVILNHTN